MVRRTIRKRRSMIRHEIQRLEKMEQDKVNLIIIFTVLFESQAK